MVTKCKPISSCQIYGMKKAWDINRSKRMYTCLVSCGHLYHFQCLQQKDCGWGCASERQQRWSCYKCSSSHGGRSGSATEAKRVRSTSLAQVCVCTSKEKESYNVLVTRITVVSPLIGYSFIIWCRLICASIFIVCCDWERILLILSTDIISSLFHWERTSY